MVEEENFPRGGRHVKATKKRQNDNLFSVNKEHKPKKAKKSKKVQNEIISDETFHSSLVIHGTLSYNKIQDGMLLLACIRRVKELSLEVEFPGLTFGYVKITSISEPFTKYLNKQLESNDGVSDILKNIFKIGQFVLVKVLQVENTDGNIKVECTLSPKEVNSDKSHVSFKKGMLAWGCVQSVLDHGYEINLGVKNCRVFLPNKNVDEGKTFGIGEPLWCIIHKSEISNVATTLRVSAKEQHVRASKIEEVNSLHDLIPGMQVEVVIDKITTTGIQGNFINNYFGYIDESQLKYPLKKPEDYQEGKLITAYIMYIEPTTKISHLTLRSLEPLSELTHKIGDIVSAEVISKHYTGIYLKLSSKEKCFVSNRRLMESLSKKANIDIGETIRLKFSPGSKHTCRILDYSHFSRVYVSTVEKSLVKEKLFNSGDVQPGQLVDVKIDSVKTSGLVVTCGHIKGFVPNLYLSNNKFSEKFKKKYKEGQKLKARVLHIGEDGNVIYTLKPGQVESDKCLKLLSEAKRGDCYTGVVVDPGSAGALVIFYGNVKGWLSKRYLFSECDAVDMTNFFYKGQVINTWILGVKQNQVLLSMKQPPEFDLKVKLAVGKFVRGTVAKIHKDRIDIKSKRGKLLGTLPANHLSTSTSLSSTFMKTFKIGDEVNDIICVDNENQPNILSRREALVIRKNKSAKLRKLEELKAGFIIRCSYMSDCDSGIYVKPLLLDFTGNVLISNKNIVAEGEKLPRFQKYQCIVTKVLKVDISTKSLVLTALFDKVFDSRVESTVSFFSQHLLDVNYLKKFGLENDWDTCQYSAGQRIDCKVDKVAEAGGCSVLLPNGVQGLVAPRLCPDDVKAGRTMKGVFLDLDFKHSYVEVCLRQDICQKINKTQDGTMKCSNLASCIAENVIIKNDLVICVLRQLDGNKQLVYCPLFLHENDQKSCKNFYERTRLKLCICGKVDNCLVGMCKRLFMKLDKKHESIKKLKQLRKAVKSDSQKSKEAVSKTNDDDDNGQKSESVGDAAKLKSTENKKLSKRQIKQIPLKQSKKLENESSGSDEEDIGIEIDSGDLEDVYINNIVNDEEVDFNTYDSDETNVVDSDENIRSDAESGDEDTEDVGNSDQNPETDTESCNEDMEVEEDDTHNEVLSNDMQRIISKKLKDASKTDNGAILPGVQSFFMKNEVEVIESSGDEEEVLDVIKKKKKLTPAERAELAKLEEERISKIEKDLADPTRPLESAEQFDRSLLANPNSSEIWTRYMSFHIASTEIDKARTVAKRALESINMTLTEERLNVWLAMLNLENMFGTKESFEKTFDDAVQYNDSLTIYLKVIGMLAEAGKFIDMEEKIAKAKRKFKQDFKMWMEVAKIYYQVNKYKEARNLKDAALKSIDNKKTQMAIIVRFALLEFKYGEEDHGAAIFETILSSDPRRVDIWSTYVDQLIKKDRIEQARRVLERSISQRLPLKNMKTLFLKYRRFEEEHGTPDLVEAVKEKAVEYVNRAIKK